MRLTVRMRDPRWRYQHVYASGVVTEHNDYTGTVVPRSAFPWLDDNWFVLTTGDSESPYRILHKDNIICGWQHHHDESENTSNVFIVPGKNNRKYVVTIGDDGEARCNCTGFGYRRNCSHVAALLSGVH